MNTPIDPARAQAEMDLNDIRALRRNEPFNRYFLRGVAQKVKDIEAELTITDPSRMLAGKARRQKLGALEAWREMLTKMDRDESANMSVLGVTASEGLTD